MRRTKAYDITNEERFACRNPNNQVTPSSGRSIRHPFSAILKQSETIQYIKKIRESATKLFFGVHFLRT